MKICRQHGWYKQTHFVNFGCWINGNYGKGSFISVASSYFILPNPIFSSLCCWVYFSFIRVVSPHLTFVMSIVNMLFILAGGANWTGCYFFLFFLPWSYYASFHYLEYIWTLVNTRVMSLWLRIWHLLWVYLKCYSSLDRQINEHNRH